jgi:hypothetical protein
MRRLAWLAAAAVILIGGATAAIIAWLDRLPPPVIGAPSPSPGPAGPAVVELPQDPVERDRALERNQARFQFESLRDGFLAAKRSPGEEERLRPGLTALFPGGKPPWTLECRQRICRLEVDGPAAEWRPAFTASKKLRPHVERVAFDPDGEKLAFMELTEARLADADSARPEGDRILGDLGQSILGSAEARTCLAGGPAGAGAEIIFAIDPAGITYRFGSAVDSQVAYCLMTKALPDLMATLSTPAHVRRAELTVRIPPAR